MKPNIDSPKPNKKTTLVIMSILTGLLISSIYCLGSNIAKLEDRMEKQERLIQSLVEQAQAQQRINAVLIEIQKKHHHKKFI